MTRDNRNQPPSKDSQERADSRRDELEKPLSPDLDFPKDSPGTGGKK